MVMNRIGKVGLILSLAGMFVYGRELHGTFVDASCYNQSEKARHISKMCIPNASTTDFMFKSNSGRVYKLDSESNAKAEQAVQDGVLTRNKHGVDHAVVMAKK